jgi:spermidine/putrescine transport system permease protein
VYTIGSALVLRFLEARNWPAGAAYAAGLILIMLVVITAYLWFIGRGRQTRDVSVL